MSWSEILIVAVVALIVVGPKDLPGMFRTMGKFTAKAKRMAREFSSAMEAAADDAGVSDVQKTFKAAVNPAKAAADKASKAVRNAVDFDAMDPSSETARLAKKRAADKDAAAARIAAAKDANASAGARSAEFVKKAEAKSAPTNSPKPKSAAKSKPRAAAATKRPTSTKQDAAVKTDKKVAKSKATTRSKKAAGK